MMVWLSRTPLGCEKPDRTGNAELREPAEHSRADSASAVSAPEHHSGSQPFEEKESRLASYN
jgi:hypothetical protein